MAVLGIAGPGPLAVGVICSLCDSLGLGGSAVRAGVGLHARLLAGGGFGHLARVPPMSRGLYFSADGAGMAVLGIAGLCPLSVGVGLAGDGEFAGDGAESDVVIFCIEDVVLVVTDRHCGFPDGSRGLDREGEGRQSAVGSVVVGIQRIVPGDHEGLLRCRTEFDSLVILWRGAFQFEHVRVVGYSQADHDNAGVV